MNKVLYRNIDLKQWHKDNIFDLRKADAIAYLFFYILIPCFVTILSLQNDPSSTNEKIYCYMSILISAFNCIYDAFNRWVNRISLKNGKLFIIIISASIIVVYCIFIILGILIVENGQYQCDYLLLSYLFVVLIAMIDIVCCCTKEISWMGCVNNVGKEVH